MHQYRNVTHKLYVTVGKLVDQPVWRQPEYTQNKSEEGGKKNPAKRHQQRIQNTHNSLAR